MSICFIAGSRRSLCFSLIVVIQFVIMHSWSNKFIYFHRLQIFHILTLKFWSHFSVLSVGLWPIWFLIFRFCILFSIDLNHVPGGPKNVTVFYAITSSNINWFSQLFDSQNLEKTCNNTITKDPREGGEGVQIHPTGLEYHAILLSMLAWHCAVTRVMHQKCTIPFPDKRTKKN